MEASNRNMEKRLQAISDKQTETSREMERYHMEAKNDVRVCREELRADGDRNSMEKRFQDVSDKQTDASREMEHHYVETKHDVRICREELCAAEANFKGLLDLLAQKLAQDFEREREQNDEQHEGHLKRHAQLCDRLRFLSALKIQ